MSNGLDRRNFLKVLGVTGAGAGLTGCGTGGAERLIPYVVPHEEIAATVPRWVELEEFWGGATVDSLTDYLRELRSYLSERSGEFFLINAL